MFNLYVTISARDDIWGQERDVEYIINDMEEVEWKLEQLNDQGFDVLDYSTEEI